MVNDPTRIQEPRAITLGNWLGKPELAPNVQRQGGLVAARKKASRNSSNEVA
jgi:hypothetical protein